MVLADDVSISGGVLLNKHETLDDTLISLLQNCGITTISVVSPDDSQGPIEEGGPIAEPTAPSPPLQSDPIILARPPLKKTDLPPEIKISISPDAESAQLTLDPCATPPSMITADTILQALEAHDVVHGINRELVEKIAAAWAIEPHHIDAPGIAEATAPIAGIEGDIKMLVGHLSANSDCEKVRSMSFFHDALLEFPSIEKAARDTPIAERTHRHAATPGINVKGGDIAAPSESVTDITLGGNVRFSKDNTTIVALCNGIAYHVDTTIGVIPINFDGAFTITLSSDNMTAYCTVTPPGPGGKLPDKVALLDMLKAASVHFGVNESDIITLLSLCRQGAYPKEPFPVARGLAPVNGSDGDFLYHFNIETSLAPAINSDGSADYKAVNIIQTASAGEQLVTLIPPGDGHDGTDVFGKTLPSQKGTAARLPQGPHTAPDPNNPDSLIAETDGIVRLAGGLVEVYEGFLVKGNVDYSTGNIDYNKTIQVGGDVKSGFTIHAGGDLEVHGTIEDCHITTGGNVLCRCGFVGQGKGSIEAKGDVNLSFIKNQSVRSFKTIAIAKEAINSFLYSRASIILHGKPLSAAGGEIHAKSSITAHTVGNHTGIRTLLEVGVDYLMVDELTMVEKLIAEATAQFKKVADAFTRYQKTMQQKKNLTAQEQSKLHELTAAFKQTRQKITVLEERKVIIAGKMYTISDARITIEHAALPGTLLKFGDRHHLLREELIGPKTIIYADHDIKIC